MRRRLTAYVVGCALGLTACSGAGDDPAELASTSEGPGSDETTAASATLTPGPTATALETSTATSAVTGSAAGSVSGEELISRLVAAAEADGSATGDFSLQVTGQEVTGEAEFTLEPFAIDAVFSGLPGLGGDGGIRVVLVDDTAYLDLGGGIPLPAGKQWVSVDSNDDSPGAQAFRPILDSLGQGFDPRESFRIIEAATTWTNEGSDEVDGVQTTRYTAAADVRRLIELSTGVDREGAQLLAQQGVRKIPLTVWVDGTDLLRKIDFSVDSQAGALAAQTTYDWSAEVSVEAPPADTVVSVSRLGGG